LRPTRLGSNDGAEIPQDRRDVDAKGLVTKLHRVTSGKRNHGQCIEHAAYLPPIPHAESVVVVALCQQWRVCEDADGRLLVSDRVFKLHTVKAHLHTKADKPQRA